jgi:CRISPR-associated protein Cmr2
MAARDLVIFSLGPVQPFIATARRTQDLWVGSQLLSYLAQVGVEVAADFPHSEVFYPVRVNKHWPQSIPNRFVFAVPVGQGEKVGPEVAAAIRQAWVDVARQVYGHFAGLAPEAGWESAWERQVRAWLETYWVAWPWDGTDYGAAYRRAGLAMDARKHIRPYPRKPEPGEKCTLCGVRQALHGRRGRPRKAIREFWEGVAAYPAVTPAELRTGERLCAVCAIKRFADKAQVTVGGYSLSADRFPSTSSIATTTFKASLLKRWTDLEELIMAHLDALDRLELDFGTPDPFPCLESQAGADRLLRYDGKLFYRETFTPERLEEILGHEPDETDRRRALKTLDDLLRTATNPPYHIGPPHTYLAVLALDGDRMGKLLSECTSKEGHKQISRALTVFAEERVKTIVEEKHPGRLIYAGGDDVLAVLPVECALSVADELRRALAKGLKRAGHSDRTASAGMAIVHYMHPLEDALRMARDGEHRAKETYNRNALVVDVLRRSGERQRMGMNWSYEGGPAQSLEALEAIRQAQSAFKRKDLSSRLAYEVYEEAPVLAGEEGERCIPREAREAELVRLFKRHADEGWKTKAEALAQRVARLAEHVKWPETSRWLLLARFLAQGGER